MKIDASICTRLRITSLMMFGSRRAKQPLTSSTQPFDAYAETYAVAWTSRCFRHVLTRGLGTLPPNSRCSSALSQYAPASVRAAIDAQRGRLRLLSIASECCAVMHPRYKKLVRSKLNRAPRTSSLLSLAPFLPLAHNSLAQHYLEIMGIQDLREHKEYKMSSPDELRFQHVAKEISRWLHKAEIFPDHDHHHGLYEFYKPKRYVAASIAAARTVPGQELEKKIQLATSANEEATAHFLRT